MNLFLYTKRKFTLIEVLIALGLTLMLVSSLLFTYFQAIEATIFSERKVSEYLERRYLQKRLSEVFRNLIFPDQTKNFFFTSEGEISAFLPHTPTLTFSYNNGVNLDYQLSNEVLGRLYVDNKGNLSLLTWIERDKWEETSAVPHHIEKLMSGIKKLDFEFFSTQPEKKTWQKNKWSIEEKELPGAIKLIITTTKDKELRFIFTVPHILGVIFRKE